MWIFTFSIWNFELYKFMIVIASGKLCVSCYFISYYFILNKNMISVIQVLKDKKFKMIIYIYFEHICLFWVY